MDEKKYTEMAVFMIDNHRSFCNTDEIEHATFDDMFEAGYSKDDCGLTYEGDDEDGNELFSGYDFDGKKTIEEIREIEIDWYRIRYWDGNNWKCDVFETYTTVNAIIHELEDPSPAFYFNYELELEDGEKVKCTTSNTSGSISPYYDEDYDEEY